MQIHEGKPTVHAGHIAVAASDTGKAINIPLTAITCWLETDKGAVEVTFGNSARLLTGEYSSRFLDEDRKASDSLSKAIGRAFDAMASPAR